MKEAVGIEFKENGKVYYFDKNNLELHVGDNVIVETERGIQFGTVSAESKMINLGSGFSTKLFSTFFGAFGPYPSFQSDPPSYKNSLQGTKWNLNTRRKMKIKTPSTTNKTEVTTAILNVWPNNSNVNGSCLNNSIKNLITP